MRSTAARLERRFEARLRSEQAHLGSAELMERVVDLVRGRGARRVLDLGTGCGELLSRLRAVGLEAAGLDLCGTLLDRARKSSPGAPALIQGDVERLPLAAGRLDLVTLLLVAHYLRDPGRALFEAARVLRPDGWIILADRIASPNPALREVQDRIETLRNPSVRRMRTSEELSDELRRAGFRVRLIDFLEESVPLEAWLAGVVPPQAARIRAELRQAPTPDLGGLCFEAPDRIKVRIDLILAQKEACRPIADLDTLHRQVQ